MLWEVRKAGTCTELHALEFDDPGSHGRRGGDAIQPGAQSTQHQLRGVLKALSRTGAQLRTAEECPVQ